MNPVTVMQVILIIQYLSLARRGYSGFEKILKEKNNTIKWLAETSCQLASVPAFLNHTLWKGKHCITTTRRTESFKELDACELPVEEQRVVRWVVSSTHLNQQHAQTSCGDINDTQNQIQTHVSVLQFIFQCECGVKKRTQNTHKWTRKATKNCVQDSLWRTIHEVTVKV